MLVAKDWKACRTFVLSELFVSTGFRRGPGANSGTDGRVPEADEAGEQDPDGHRRVSRAPPAKPRSLWAWNKLMVRKGQNRRDILEALQSQAKKGDFQERADVCLVDGA